MTHRFANSRCSQLLTTARQWVMIDATGQQLEPLAKQVCKVLEGRHKPVYSNYVDMGDHVVVINTRKMVIPDKKVLWWYSGYAQGHRHVYAKDFHILRPTECLRLQVEFKLPQKRDYSASVRRVEMKGGRSPLMDRLSRLHLFPDKDHPYAANISKVLEAPENLYKSSADYSSEEREQFVKAPDSRLRKPQALYDWEELD